MEVFSVNTANTLSYRFKPGEDKRIPTAKSESIFTFGDYRIFKSTSSDTLSGDNRQLKFDSFSTLESINGTSIIPEARVFVKENEIKLPTKEPNSYTYFGSFYTDIANAINSIIENFPYAILAGKNNGITITNYSEDTTGNTSSFRIPFSALTNQGNIVINSGSTLNEITLFNNFDKFGIQLSGSSISTNTVHTISNYEFITGSTPYLQFTISGSLLSSTSITASTSPVYIRPSRERYNLYFKNLSSLESQLLNDHEFYVPDLEDNGEENLEHFHWPKTIDGFNPDSYGISFEEYKEEILQAASDIDDSKTNIMLRTMIPENYLEFDTDGEIYRKMVQVYAHEFDLIKRYIDGMAYAFTVPRPGSDEGSVPDKFLSKVARLLAWDLQGNFDEVDIFEYLTGDVDSSQTTNLQANLELWKKILSNINWLYKKKGTRDALTFIFKLLGAPDCLVNFNEFVYRVQKVSPFYVDIRFRGGLIRKPIIRIIDNPKANDNGYPDYDLGQFIFQEGGKERGNGQAYINQWRPEFDPVKAVDNKKTITGDTNVFGSENIINTKEVSLEMSSARGIECDVKTYYTVSATSCSNGEIINNTDLRMEKCEVFTDTSFSGKTLSQYLDHIYTNSIDPRNRKTIGFSNDIITHYPTLKKAYLNYYYQTSPASRQLNFRKLEAFLEKLGARISEYFFKLLPATTIIDSCAVTYRNTIFHTPKFVYKEGINAGSEFKKQFDEPTVVDVDVVTIQSTLAIVPKTTLNIHNVIVSINSGINKELNVFEIETNIGTNVKTVIPAHQVISEIEVPDTLITIVQ